MSASEQDVEVEREAALALAEEDTVHGVRDVVVKALGVEVVAEIEAAHRKAHGVLRRKLNVFGETRIQRNEERVPVLIGVPT